MCLLLMQPFGQIPVFVDGNIKLHGELILIINFLINIYL